VRVDELVISVGVDNYGSRLTPSHNSHRTAEFFNFVDYRGEVLSCLAERDPPVGHNYTVQSICTAYNRTRAF